MHKDMVLIRVSSSVAYSDDDPQVNDHDAL